MAISPPIGRSKLIGLSEQGLPANRMLEAQADFKSAAASASLLSEDGPPVKELAQAKVTELQR